MEFQVCASLLFLLFFLVSFVSIYWNLSVVLCWIVNHNYLRHKVFLDADINACLICGGVGFKHKQSGLYLKILSTDRLVCITSLCVPSWVYRIEILSYCGFCRLWQDVEGKFVQRETTHFLHCRFHETSYRSHRSCFTERTRVAGLSSIEFRGQFRYKNLYKL